jgi:8-oxo-dGTP pyrophosphatase MutT (NUDIX family)
MYIKIYFNDKPLFLADSVDSSIEPYAHHDDAIYMDEFSTPGVNSIIHEMRLAKIHAGIFVHADLEALKKAFWKKFTVIKAAGGVVANEAGELLFIFRRNKWDLPKGKLDKGESIEACAVRETEEETGLTNVQAGPLLLTTYHTYDENGKHFLKETYWYKLSVTGDQHPAPQTEEQITALEWANPGSLEKYKSNTFPSIIDVLEAYGV